MNVRHLFPFSCCLAVAACIAMSSCGAGKGTSSQDVSADTYCNPLYDTDGNLVTFGDPYILKASDGRFYMYGTTDYTFMDHHCYSSDDLVNWKHERICYVPSDSTWTTDTFWAPEVYEHDGKFYMFHSSNWKENPNGE